MCCRPIKQLPNLPVALRLAVPCSSRRVKTYRGIKTIAGERREKGRNSACHGTRARNLGWNGGKKFLLVTRNRFAGPRLSPEGRGGEGRKESRAYVFSFCNSVPTGFDVTRSRRSPLPSPILHSESDGATVNHRGVKLRRVYIN